MGCRQLSARRKFFTITLPGAKYGLISAALVSFTLVMTDFGIPKVIGGNFNVLATDVFKLVIGQQDFQKGAVVALLLLAPAMLTFAVDHWVSRRQTAMLTAQLFFCASARAPSRMAVMSAWWITRSMRAVAEVALGKMVGQSEKARLVVSTRLFCS